MTQEEYTHSVASKVGVSDAEASDMMNSFISEMLEQLKAGQTVAVQGFGSFETRRKAERKMYNPTTKDFKIIPSKMSLNFKMSNALKGRINS
ncbi:MAG: HU family DNA-binding protein [Bacteroidaceae bacterium]|nr:HU family DNA-binding protein [Bacteroidaceae bacterium]